MDKDSSVPEPNSGPTVDAASQGAEVQIASVGDNEAVEASSKPFFQRPAVRTLLIIAGVVFGVYLAVVGALLLLISVGRQPLTAVEVQGNSFSLGVIEKINLQEGLRTYSLLMVSDWEMCEYNNFAHSVEPTMEAVFKKGDEGYQLTIQGFQAAEKGHCYRQYFTVPLPNLNEEGSVVLTVGLQGKQATLSFERTSGQIITKQTGDDLFSSVPSSVSVAPKNVLYIQLKNTTGLVENINPLAKKIADKLLAIDRLVWSGMGPLADYEDTTNLPETNFKITELRFLGSNHFDYLSGWRIVQPHGPKRADDSEEVQGQDLLTISERETLVLTEGFLGGVVSYSKGVVQSHINKVVGPQLVFGYTNDAASEIFNYLQSVLSPEELAQIKVLSATVDGIGQGWYEGRDVVLVENGNVNTYSLKEYDKIIAPEDGRAQYPGLPL